MDAQGDCVLTQDEVFEVEEDVEGFLWGLVWFRDGGRRHLEGWEGSDGGAGETGERSMGLRSACGEDMTRTHADAIIAGVHLAVAKLPGCREGVEPEYLERCGYGSPGSLTRYGLNRPCIFGSDRAGY
jgi:hypothetical protein